ncbi:MULTISPECIES: hypothetical protein [unclassified Leptospira]|uniref:hypothetical protein n=1 Tax=unclassified Leptospira TaxID=2633828 RepID=UPI0002BDBB08|nr:MULTISPECIES: hypothetical protein [unclassified Leptospira]EMK02429.1 hypothetical protein LEP1GSC192_3036 [Leptospira sp. B5-022]MCR1795599.1 hypothetical protein [Leptospira sp. id769339]
MGYFLEAIIGKREEIGKSFKSEESFIIELPHEFAMIPLKREFLKKINIENNENFESEIIRWLSVRSNDSKFALISAEFFGGTGGQTAQLFRNGSIVEEFSFQSNAINNVLKLLGLERSIGQDQFDLVELSRYRDTEDWK